MRHRSRAARAGRHDHEPDRGDALPANVFAGPFSGVSLLRARVLREGTSNGRNRQSRSDTKNTQRTSSSAISLTIGDSAHRISPARGRRYPRQEAGPVRPLRLPTHEGITFRQWIEHQLRAFLSNAHNRGLYESSCTRSCRSRGSRRSSSGHEASWSPHVQAGCGSYAYSRRSPARKSAAFRFRVAAILRVGERSPERPTAST